MTKSKKEQLKRLSEQLDEEYQYINRNMKTNYKKGLMAKVDNVKSLNELYRLTSLFPVWPFNMGTIRRFGTAWIAPLIPIVLAYLFELFGWI